MPTAILLPGSASTSDFVRRTFAPLLSDLEVAPWTPRGGDAGEIADQLQRFIATRTGESLTVVGVSIGAHAAALWASAHQRDRTRLLLALPAWTGPASQVAGMTALAAQRIEERGLASELESLAEQFPGDWVTEELLRAWGSADPTTLVATLRATAASAAPTQRELNRISMPTLVLGLHGDPLHPWQVAREWAAAIPHCELVGLSRREPQSDPTSFGRAARQTAWAGQV